MAKAKFKTVKILVELKIPDFLTKTEARREVKSLINDGCQYSDSKYIDGEFKEISVKAVKVTSLPSKD